MTVARTNADADRDSYYHSSACLCFGGRPCALHPGLGRFAVWPGEAGDSRRGTRAVATWIVLPGSGIPEGTAEPLCSRTICLWPSYISLESALSHHGWNPEGVLSVTSVCSGESNTFRTPVATFRYSRIPQNLFYAAVVRETTSDTGDVMLIAQPVKALAETKCHTPRPIRYGALGVGRVLR